MRESFVKQLLRSRLGRRCVHKSLNENDNVYHIDKKHIIPYYETYQKPASIVALSFVKNKVCHIQMDSSFNIIAWDAINLFDNVHPKRSDHSNFQSEVWKTVQKLPSSDIYLMEHFIQQMPSSSSFNSVLHRTYLEAVFFTLLNHPAMGKNNKLYKLKSTNISQFFGILLGNQRMECSSMVKNIFEGGHELSKEVRIPFPLGNNFLCMEKLLQEHMTYCFLQCIFFYKSLVLKFVNEKHHIIN